MFIFLLYHHSLICLILPIWSCSINRPPPPPITTTTTTSTSSKPNSTSHHHRHYCCLPWPDSAQSPWLLRFSFSSSVRITSQTLAMRTLCPSSRPRWSRPSWPNCVLLLGRKISWGIAITYIGRTRTQRTCSSNLTDPCRQKSSLNWLWCWFIKRAFVYSSTIKQSTANLTTRVICHATKTKSFHDVALWTDSVLNYLDPSYEQVAKSHKDLSAKDLLLVHDIIVFHHKVTPFEGPHRDVVRFFLISCFFKEHRTHLPCLLYF